MPSVGDHIEVSGSYVLDRETTGWRSTGEHDSGSRSVRIGLEAGRLVDFLPEQNGGRTARRRPLFSLPRRRPNGSPLASGRTAEAPRDKNRAIPRAQYPAFARGSALWRVQQFHIAGARVLAKAYAFLSASRHFKCLLEDRRTTTRAICSNW